MTECRDQRHLVLTCGISAHRKAIERIGAVKEGVLRNHMILPDGRIRHSVFYSVIDTEWPETKKRLEEMLAR
jgi:hypothetical protein